MSEKKKKHSNHVGTIPFAFLWTLSYAVGWSSLFATALLINNLFQQFLNPIPDPLLAVTFGIIPGLVSGAIQQPLIRWKFGTQVKRWWLWSTIGSMLGMSGFYLYIEYLQSLLTSVIQYLNQINPLLEPVIVIGVLFIIYSTLQAWALRHAVRRVWLWSLAAFVSASTFILPLINTSTSNEFVQTILIGIAGLAQGSVMALTLVWLFGVTRTDSLKSGIEMNRLQQISLELATNDNDEMAAIYPQSEEILRQRK